MSKSDRRLLCLFLVFAFVISFAAVAVRAAVERAHPAQETKETK